MMRRWVPVLLLALVTAVAWPSAVRDEANLTPVTFMAGFRPQANLPFVAAYVAQELGYFAEAGLQVNIQHSTGQHLQLLLSGDVHVTTAAAASVLKRRADPGLPIKAIALFGQAGQQTFVARADAGIRTPQDWEGRTIGYRISLPPEYLALLDAAGVDRAQIREVRVGFDPRVLTEGRVDVLAVFKSNEPDTIRRLGYELIEFDPDDYGVPTLGLTYITREDLIESDPELLERFVTAAMRGLQFAFDHLEASLDIVMRFAEQEDREHMRFMLAAELRDAVSAVTDAHGPAAMTVAQWRSFHDLLLRHTALARSIDPAAAFTMRFLEAAYAAGGELHPVP
jgi:ABC-type nitrate/sulfonate/bicarbonate transport system substrate-binding protein